MPQREQMTSADRAWLLMDRSTNRMVINGLWIFREPVDPQRMVQTMEERLSGFRRFRQQVVEPNGSLGQAFWQDDPNFDIRAHFKRIAVPSPGDKQTMQELISSLVTDPLDPSRPLWMFYLIEGYNGGSVVLGRIHHSIADGMALVQVLLSMTDPSPENSWEAPERRQNSAGPIARLIRQTNRQINAALETGEFLLNQGVRLAGDPEKALALAQKGGDLATKTTQVLAKLGLMTGDSPTVFKGDLGITKRVAWSKVISLEDVKFVKNSMGATVNDVLVSALTGGLRRYMIHRGDDPAGKEVRSMVPVNVRPLDAPIEMGNQFALVYLSLPVYIEDPIDRLFEVKRRMDRIKQSPEAVLTYQIINAIGLLPGDVSRQIIEYFGSKASAVLTNVPGPTEKLYFAGKKIDRMIAWVPQSGSIGMGLSILSYGGEVGVGIIADEGLVPDPDGVMAGFEAEFNTLLHLARLPAQEAERPARDANAMADELLAQFDALKGKMERG